MTDELISQLLQYGGGVAIIVALIFLITKGIIPLIGTRKDNNVAARLKKIETNDLGDLEYIRERLDLLQRDFNDFKGKVEVRLAKIEAKINGRQN